MSGPREPTLGDVLEAVHDLGGRLGARIDDLEIRLTSRA